MQPNAIPNITKKRDLQHYPTLPNATPLQPNIGFMIFSLNILKLKIVKSG